jgi:uncharacterized repeat protein (TIGR03847 family)
MSTNFELDELDRFVAGAIGMPGDRIFYFQVVAGSKILSFKCEKMQVQALGEAIQKILVDVPSLQGKSNYWTNLDLPALNEWNVGTIGIGYEPALDKVIVIFEELVPDDEEGGKARFSLSREQAATFALNFGAVLAGGRPQCVVCSLPIDVDGYNCVCLN